MPLNIVLTDDPDAEALKQINDNLTAFIEGDIGPSGRKDLALFAYDEKGEMAAGLSAYTARGWLFIQWLWVSETQRNQGLAASLIARAEAEAVARGCHGAWIDTFSPVAFRLYEKLGYKTFGVLEDFPLGRSRSFLKKSLAPKLA